MALAAAGAATPSGKSFYVAGVVDPEKHYVVDRSSLHDKLVADLSGGAFVLLHAHRQGGKSSAVRAVGSQLMGSGFLVVTCTIESARPTDESAMWKALASRVAVAISALPKGSVPAAVLERITPGHSLFVDSATFEAMFVGALWGTSRIVLIIDEFDTLLEAPDAVRNALLSSLRSLRTRNAIAPEQSGSPSALFSVLGIGVYRLLQLATGDDPRRAHSPFNVSDAQSVPLTSLEDARRMLAEFSSDVDHAVPEDVIADLHRRSGGHVGLLSLLGQQLAQLCSRLAPGKGVETVQWFSVASGSSLLGVLRESATVASMLRSVSDSIALSPVALAARSLVRDMLSAPEDAWLDVADADVNRSNALAYLMTEGVIVMDRSGPTAVHRIVAPVVVPLLLRDVGSNALVSRMPRLSLPINPRTGGINLMQTLLELLPFINVAALFHPYAALARGAPCEYAYHFQLFDLLSRRASDGGWRLLGESRNASLAHGRLRRLDLFIASNGRRCGIELLAEGNALFEHMFEQAPTYRAQQNLESLLVVNFASQESALIRRMPLALPDHVELLQVWVCRKTNTLTPYLLGGKDGLDAVACAQITEDADGGAENLVAPLAAAPKRVAEPSLAGQMQTAASAGMGASATPLFVACEKISWVLEPSDTIDGLVAKMLADLPVGGSEPRGEMWLLRGVGADAQLGKSQRAGPALRAARDAGARLELRISDGGQSAAGGPPTRVLPVALE